MQSVLCKSVPDMPCTVASAHLTPLPCSAPCPTLAKPLDVSISNARTWTVRSYRIFETYAKIVSSLQTTLIPARQSTNSRIIALCRRGLADRAAGHRGPCSLHSAHDECPPALQAVCCRLGTFHAEANCWYVRQVAGASCQSCQRIIQGDLTKHTIIHLQCLSGHAPLSESKSS